MRIQTSYSLASSQYDHRLQDNNTLSQFNHLGSLFGALDGIENRGVLREDWLGRPLNERIVPDWTFTIDDHVNILAQMQKKQSPATLTNKEEKSA